MTRDLTQAQFVAACKRHGFERRWLGYWDIGNGCEVCAANAGDNRRAQLAYLIKARDRQEAKEAQSCRASD